MNNRILIAVAVLLLAVPVVYNRPQAEARTPQSTVRARIHNGSAPGANTDMITDFTPTSDAVLEVTVQLTTSSVFNMMVTDGTTEHAGGINSSSALNAGDRYVFEFDVPANKADGTALVYNFQVETDSVIETLFVRERPIQ